MKKKITLIRLVHDGHSRIGLRHKFDPGVNARVRKLPGARYSGTNKVWHVEYRSDIVGFLNNQFKNQYDLDSTQLTGDFKPDAAVAAATAGAPPRAAGQSQTQATYTAGAPPAPTAGAAAQAGTKTVPSATPLRSGRAETVPSATPLRSGRAETVPSATPLRSDRSPGQAPPTPTSGAAPAGQTQTQTTPTPTPGATAPPTTGPQQSAGYDPGFLLPAESSIQRNVAMANCRVEMANVPGSDKMMIKFHGYYAKEWIAEMRQYGYVEYLKHRKEFRLPWSRIAMDSLSDYFMARGVQVEVRRNKMPGNMKSQRDELAAEVRSRELGAKALGAVKMLEAHIREKRQSESTVKTYSSMLQLFFRYFNDREPLQIGESDISAFMADFVLPLGYSSSFQNQLITAIKTYYSLTSSKIRGEKLLRPKRSRSLPKVFSKEEIRRILNGTANIKHRLILWLIYSCGLRRGEVLNIKLSDLDRDRSILHIREGKGKVDRVVPISAKVWDKIDEYNEAFSPAIYLFEGTGGGKYSAGSVYNVFKRALWKAGIKKEVGVHALRHSYATHLHESGLDIRFIQELLGHRSSRTTEIYTHVSRRNLMSIKSPIDDIDLK